MILVVHMGTRNISRFSRKTEAKTHLEDFGADRRKLKEYITRV
jgi:hypothetical protein